MGWMRRLTVMLQLGAKEIVPHYQKREELTKFINYK